MSDEVADQPTVTRRGPTWGRIAAAVMRDPAIVPQAKAVYALLATYADNADRDCFPRQETMALQLGVSVDTIQRHLKVLEQAGVIEVEARYRPDGGRSSNDYVLVDALTDSPGKGRTGAVSIGRTDAVSPSRTDAVPRTRPVEQDQLNSSPPTPQGEDPAPGLFLVGDPEKPAAKAKGSRGQHLPETWKPNDQHLGFVVANGLVGSVELEQFRDHHIARGTVMKDWDAAFRTWLRNAVKYAGRTPVPAGTEPVEENRWMARRPQGFQG